MHLLIWGQVFPESSRDKWNRGCQVVTRQDGKGPFHHLNTCPKEEQRTEEKVF